MSTNGILSISWQFSETRGVTNYGSGGKKDIITRYCSRGTKDVVTSNHSGVRKDVVTSNGSGVRKDIITSNGSSVRRDVVTSYGIHMQSHSISIHILWCILRFWLSAEMAYVLTALFSCYMAGAT